MTKFGTGPTLREAHPWLQDDGHRRSRILDVVERNSVIEGLPPLDDETRERLPHGLEVTCVPPATPGGSLRPSVRDPS